MVNIENPHTEDVFMILNGETFTIPAMTSRVLPREVAEHWKTDIHSFLIITEIGTVKEDVKETASVEEVEKKVTKK